MRVERVSVNALKPNDWNPNKMSKRQFEHLVREIKRVGYVDPIIVREKKDFYEIIDGEHRWKAVKKIGFDEVDVVVVDVDDVTAKSLTVNLNRIKGEIDLVKFSKVLEDLEKEMDVRTVFDITSTELDLLKKVYDEDKSLSVTLKPSQETPSTEKTIILDLTKEQSKKIREKYGSLHKVFKKVDYFIFNY